LDGVLTELRYKLKEGPRPDFIGLAGSGEPTLHGRLAEIVDGIKTLTNVPIALLTNGSLLWKSEVRAGLAQVDLVIPSLDAGSPAIFQRVNRPHTEISFQKMVDGLVSFSHAFKGNIWLEVFVLAGITDQREEINRIANIVDKMRIDRVQLNTVSRPAAEASALTVATEDLEKLRCLFSCPCEVIAESRQSQHDYSSSRNDIEDRILALVSRRPCTIEGIANGLGLRPNEVIKHLDVLCAKEAIRSERRGEAVFYKGIRKP